MRHSVAATKAALQGNKMASTSSRVSESPNALTTDIDVSSPEQIVRILRQSDAQMFAGYGGWDGLFDKRTINALCQVGSLRAHFSLRIPHV